MAEKLYYIQDSRNYTGNAVMWWGKDYCGYTANIINAGKYTFLQAEQICKRSTDKAYECDYIDTILRNYVDSQDLERSKEIKFP